MDCQDIIQYWCLRITELASPTRLELRIEFQLLKNEHRTKESRGREGEIHPIFAPKNNNKMTST